MKLLQSIISLLISISSFCQKVDGFGFRHFQTMYRGDSVDILIKSKKGEEHIRKPLLLFCQGSLPIPLIIKYSENGVSGIYSVFPFNPDSLCNKYHLAIIGKPYIPLTVDRKDLLPNLAFGDSAKGFSPAYVKRNLLDYYVKRNIRVLKFLRKQRFVSSSKLVVAGHSEGSAIAANVAYRYKKVKALIYSGGSPLGRIMSIIERERNEQLKDTTIRLEETFNYWKSAVENKNSVESIGDTYKGLYQFSNPPPVQVLTKLTIPVLVTFGTKDFGAVAQNDYLRISLMIKRKTNFTFKEYLAVDHNFFPLSSTGEPDFSVFNWDNVAEDWRLWLNRQ